MNIFIIFPIHLFSDISNLKDKKVYLIEEPRFFTDFKYHKLKLAYHRATMKSYFDFLLKNKINVNYIDYNENIINLYKSISKKNIYAYDLGDNVLETKLKKYIQNINIVQTLNFLVNKELLLNNINEFYSEKQKYNHQNFYKWQRIRLNILIDKNKKPIGGKWSFDTENRKKIPNNVKVPNILSKLNDVNNKYINEAIIYINNNFNNNYGSLDNFIYPINHNDTIKWLEYFIKNKFENFGIYEDAVSDKDPFLFHSVLTPMMNIGLITDNEVLDIILKYKDKISIQSFEGFIRQVIGWRNYIYGIYLLEGDNMKSMNFFNHTNSLKKDVMWNGNTDILPIDNIIKKINDYSYAHHIERLMYLGNFMLLCLIAPNDVYEIFMEWTIDAYEWVMIPNVYGMSQYADGGNIMKRPYFASSNYILKMSDHKKGKWCNIFDALYYNFINNHEEYLSKNYFTSRQVAHWRKKSEKDKKDILKKADFYIKNIIK